VGELTAETIKLKIGVKDALGNTSEAASGMLTVDNDPPADISASINQGELIMSRSISLAISATDAAEMFVDGDIEGQKTWIAYAESLGIELTEGDGTKQITVQFRDDMRNESGVASDQTLLDTTPPTGSIVINDGDEISISLKVSLTLSAADDNGVESYQLRNDGGPWTDPAPYPDQDVQWDLSQDGNTTEGLRTVEVKYRDKVGNWGETYSDSILVDSTAPSIKAWTVDDKQEAMEAIVVRAVISGDRAITEANLHYGKKGTSQYTTVPMVKVPGPGDEYTAEIPGMDVTLDGVEYYFSASDGLWTSRLPAEGSIVNVFSFTVVDKTNPIIEHDPVTKISVNFSPEIVAIVSDAVGLKRVNLFYKPESDWGFTEVDMTATATPDEYTASIPPQSYLSVVYYYIEAEDVSGNVRTSPSRGASQPNTIAFVDTESPVIAHTNIEDGQEAGDPVIVGAKITDNMDVAEALLEYKVSGKVESIVVEMTPVSTYYSAEIPGEFAMPGIIEYTITASDGSPQSNDVTVSHSFTVIDSTPPNIQLAFVPSETEVHNDITIKADVTDNVGVESVILNYKGVTDTTWQELAMKAVGTAYSATIPAQGQPGVVQFYVYAVDPYGVWSTSPALDPQNSPLLIDIIDVINPVIEHSPVVGMQEAGIPLTISATVTDNVEVVDVSLHYRTAGENSYKITAMSETGTPSVYSGIIPGLEVVPPGAEYFIEAMDESANITTHYASGTLPHSFIVVDTVPPEIVYDPAPLETVLTTDIIVVTLKATDTVGIKEIKIFYRGETETEYNVLICNKIGDDRYSNTIPTPLAEGMVYYYIQAEDNSGNMSTSPAVDPRTQPHSIFVDDDSPPASPTRLVANSAPDGVIMLNWESSISPDVGRYNIYTDSGGGIVDYSNVYDFVDSSFETWESPSLAEGIYIFVVRAMDKSGNEEKNTNSRSAEADATKPQPVTGLSAKSRPGGRILLEWALSTSGDSAAYNIYSDNAQVSIDYSTPVARINDPGKSWTSEVLRDGLLYRFVVRCQDRAGNEEKSVNFVSARADATPPSGVTQLNSSTHIVNRWSNVPRVTVDWNHSEDTGTGLAGYSVLWNTAARTIPDTTIDMSATVSPRSTFDANAQYPSSSNQYYFHIRPADNAENWSQETIHFGPILIDTELPNPPTGLLAVPLAGGKISLSWTASSSSDVVEYSIYWDEGTGSGIDYSSALATVSATEWTSVTLGNGINYQFGVRAEDQAGNEEKNTQAASSVSDSEPPVIVHEPIAGMLEQEIVSVMIEAVVTDASPLDKVELHYRKRGESSYKDVAMTAGANNSRKAEIPSSVFSSAGVDYYISASDQAGNVSTHPVLTIIVSSTLEIPVSASGDEISIGYSTSLTFPAGAVSSGTILSVSVPRAAPAPQAGLGKHIITRELGLNTELGKSINLTLHYSDAEAAGEDESNLGLYLWDGQRWEFLAIVNPQLNEASITTMKLGIFSIIGDTEPPSVGELQPSVYSEPDTPITARIEDSGSGIDPQGIEIMINGQNYNVPGTALRGQAFSFTLPEDHKPGNYSLQLTVKDNVGNLTVRNSTFQVEGELALKNVYCFPNPFRPDMGVHFAYTLTEAVNKVTIRIFGMDGKLVYRIDNASALLGENLVEWNCEDEAGDLVLSSVYICHIEAEGPEETADKTIKIAGWQ